MKLCMLVCVTMLIAAQVFAVDETPWGPAKSGLASRLTCATGKPAVGQPLLLTLEVKAAGAADAKYDAQQAAVNGSLNVTGPDGNKVPYIGPTVQTSGGATPLKSGESRKVFDKLDVCEQYLIDSPGEYRIQSRARGGVPESNVLTVTVGAGTPTDLQKLLVSLRKATPAGWQLANYSGSIMFLSSPTGLKSDATSITLFFAKVPMGGFKPQRGQPAAVDLGDTKLGHAWLSAESKAAVERWPNYAQVIGDQVRAIQK